MENAQVLALPEELGEGWTASATEAPIAPAKAGSLSKNPNTARTQNPNPNLSKEGGPKDSVLDTNHPVIDKEWALDFQFSEEQVQSILLAQEELHSRLAIGRAVGQSPGYTAVAKILKDRFPESLISVQNLSRGFFRAEFTDREAAVEAISSRTVVGEGKTLQLFQWRKDFSPENPSSSISSGYIIRVQFPGLDPVLSSEHWLRSLAGKIGEVLIVENKDAALKRPGGPLITVKVSDIAKLPGCILLHLPDGSGTLCPMSQEVSYSGLPDQCNRCRKFGHPASKCPLNKAKTDMQGRGKAQADTAGAKEREGDGFKEVKARKKKKPRKTGKAKSKWQEKSSTETAVKAPELQKSPAESSPRVAAVARRSAVKSPGEDVEMREATLQIIVAPEIQNPPEESSPRADSAARRPAEESSNEDVVMRESEMQIIVAPKVSSIAAEGAKEMDIEVPTGKKSAAKSDAPSVRSSRRKDTSKTSQEEKNSPQKEQTLVTLASSEQSLSLSKAPSLKALSHRPEKESRARKAASVQPDCSQLVSKKAADTASLSKIGTFMKATSIEVTRESKDGNVVEKRVEITRECRDEAIIRISNAELSEAESRPPRPPKEKACTKESPRSQIEKTPPKEKWSLHRIMQADPAPPRIQSAPVIEEIFDEVQAPPAIKCPPEQWRPEDFPPLALPTMTLIHI